MKLVAFLNPLAARSACCSKPSMPSTGALLSAPSVGATAALKAILDALIGFVAQWVRRIFLTTIEEELDGFCIVLSSTTHHCALGPKTRVKKGSNLNSHILDSVIWINGRAVEVMHNSTGSCPQAPPSPPMTYFQCNFDTK